MDSRSYIDSLMAEVEAKLQTDAERAGQMTLGGLIDALGALDGAMPISVDRFSSSSKRKSPAGGGAG